MTLWPTPHAINILSRRSHLRPKTLILTQLTPVCLNGCQLSRFGALLDRIMGTKHVEGVKSMSTINADDECIDSLGFNESECAASSDRADEEQRSDMSVHNNDRDDEGEGDSEDDDDGTLGSWQQLVFQRSGEAMTHLNVFAVSGAGFEHLVVLNLQQNALHDLTPLLAVARSLRVLNVSQNQLTKLPSANFWARFSSLTLCFLAHNRIQHWRDADGIEACSKTLLWLTLHGNPIAALANARAFVVNKLPFLRAMDDFVVTDCELMKTHGREREDSGLRSGGDVADCGTDDHVGCL